MHAAAFITTYFLAARFVYIHLVHLTSLLFTWLPYSQFTN